MKVSRRRFVSSSAGAVVAAGLGAEAQAMLLDGVPATPNFSALPLRGNSSAEPRKIYPDATWPTPTTTAFDGGRDA